MKAQNKNAATKKTKKPMTSWAYEHVLAERGGLISTGKSTT
jgi:hypothetical protein